MEVYSSDQDKHIRREVPLGTGRWSYPINILTRIIHKFFKAVEEGLSLRYSFEISRTHSVIGQPPLTTRRTSLPDRTGRLPSTGFYELSRLRLIQEEAAWRDAISPKAVTGLLVISKMLFILSISSIMIPLAGFSHLNAQVQREYNYADSADLPIYNVDTLPKVYYIYKYLNESSMDFKRVIILLVLSENTGNSDQAIKLLGSKVKIFPTNFRLRVRLGIL